MAPLPPTLRSLRNRLSQIYSSSRSGAYDRRIKKLLEQYTHAGNIPPDELDKLSRYDKADQKTDARAVNALLILREVFQHYHINRQTSLVYQDLVDLVSGVERPARVRNDLLLDLYAPDYPLRLYRKMERLGDINKAQQALYLPPAPHTDIKGWIKALHEEQLTDPAVSPV